MKNNLVSIDEVKSALGIDSFRNLSKDKVMEFVSLIPSMDKELSMKIIEQFPTYAEYSQNIISQLNNLCDKALEKNDASLTITIESYRKILDDLSLLLQKESITVDERKYITEKMIEWVIKQARQDRECDVIEANYVIGNDRIKGLLQDLEFQEMGQEGNEILTRLDVKNRRNHDKKSTNQCI